MTGKRTYWIWIFAAILMGACSEHEEGTQPTSEYCNDDCIFVAKNDVRKASGVGEDDTEETEPIIIGGFEKGDLLYFSQMPQGKDPNFSDFDKDALNYLYIYEYNETENASWSEGYNFQVHEDKKGFNWDDVLKVGPSGNAFKFFGFYFPVDQTPTWCVQTNQTGSKEDGYSKENFMKSDIMGAYHATSSIFTRMRFRLFHLMTYLKVTLYVPVYDGSSDNPDDLSYSGYNEGALQGGYVMDAITDFTIEWAVAKSSDSEAPLVQTKADAKKQHIQMYRHQSDESSIKSLEVADYYSEPVDGITDGVDKVRTYHFSVLFPTQNFDGNFLCFALQTPGGTTKYYYFSAAQLISHDGDSFGLTQGTLQQLYLYLPRKTNQTVLVSAKILPWKDATTDMTVNKQSE